MNILLVTGAIPHALGRSGSSVVLSGQLAVLAARHAVTLVTFAPADGPEKVALAKWRADGVVVRAVAESVPASLIRLKRRWEERFAGLHRRDDRRHRIAPSPLMQRLIDRLLGQQPFDLIHAENLGVGHYRYTTNVPKVLTEHEVGRTAVEEPDEWRKVQPSIWRQFDRVQVFTPRDAATLSAAAPDLAGRVHVNPFGIDLPPAVDPAREELATVLFVGGFTHPPNVDAAAWLAREIMPMVRTRHPGATLCLVGAAPPKAVTELADPTTIVTGEVTALEPYLERATVVLAPVRMGGGMRLKVLHALAMGKAVVTTPLGAEGLAGPLDQLPLAVAETPAGLAEAASHFLSSTEARHQVGIRARAFISRHHTWSAYAERLEAIYAELRVR